MIFKVLTLHTKMLSMVYHLVMMIKTSKNIDKLNSDLNHAFDDIKMAIKIKIKTTYKRTTSVVKIKLKCKIMIESFNA